jgi:hypothetical protein
MKRLLNIFFIVLTLSLLSKESSAQNFIDGPSTSILDVKSLLVNPAALSFRSGQFSMGVKMYQIGFDETNQLGYRQGFLSLSDPTLVSRNLGMGLFVNYFDSPIFAKSQAGLSFSYRLLNSLSAGVAVSTLYHGYNSSNFQLDDPNDPVFDSGNSKMSINSSIGLMYLPTSELHLAAGVRNLNTPSISLIDNAFKLEREFFAGASYSLNNWRAIMELKSMGSQTQIQAFIESFTTQGFYARVGTNSEFDSGIIELQSFLFGSLSVNYQFQMPLNNLLGASYGTHMVSIIFDFNRLPNVPPRAQPKESLLEYSFVHTNPVVNTGIIIYSESDHLKVLEQNIERRIGETVPASALQSLTKYDLLYFDSVSDTLVIPYSKYIPAGPISESVSISQTMSDLYTESLDKLSSSIQQQRIEGITFVVNQGTSVRASGLRNRINSTSGRLAVLPVYMNTTSNLDSTMVEQPFASSMMRLESNTILSQKTTEVDIFITQELDIRTWEFIVNDSNGRLVYLHRASGAPPNTFVWDYKNNEGKIILPGIYEYSVRTVTAQGSIITSNKRVLYVQKTERNVVLTISVDPSVLDKTEGTIRLILKNN